MSSEELRQFVFERAKGCCEYCLSQRKFSPDPFSVEHILPRAKDGVTEKHNLALSCQGCNAHKFTAVEAPDPVSLKLVSLYNPRTETWNSHFCWSSDFLRILGKSATGRATIERLRINREEVVNLRLVLAELGKHPPDYTFD